MRCAHVFTNINKNAFQLNSNCPLADSTGYRVGEDVPIDRDPSWTSLNMSWGVGWACGPVQGSPSWRNQMTDIQTRLKPLPLMKISLTCGSNVCHMSWHFTEGRILEYVISLLTLLFSKPTAVTWEKRIVVCVSENKGHINSIYVVLQIILFISFDGRYNGNEADHQLIGSMGGRVIDAMSVSGGSRIFLAGVQSPKVSVLSHYLANFWQKTA